jgi:hypothetical protein
MQAMEATEVILAYGHENIQASHKATLEITKETNLSRTGTCIIAVSANKALADLSLWFKEIMCKNGAKLTVLIEAGNDTELVRASGDSHLVLTHPTDMVIRKSNYICSRTLAIKADKAACDLSKNIVAKLKNPEQQVKITLTARL